MPVYTPPMTIILAALLVFGLVEIVGLGYLIFIDYKARNTFTPGEAAIFREMRRVLDEAR
jgi:hypothetical protein